MDDTTLVDICQALLGEVLEKPRLIRYTIAVVSIKAELDARGWNQTRLAEESGIPDSTISKIIKNPDQIPKLENLALLARAFKVPLSRLIAACGYDVDSSVLNDRERLESIIHAIPDFRQLVEELMTFSPDDQADVMAYIEMRRKFRLRQPVGG